MQELHVKYQVRLVLLCDLFNGKSFHVNMQASQLSGKHPSSITQQLQQISPAAKSLICKMLLKAPKDRISAAQALQHEFCHMA